MSDIEREAALQEQPGYSDGPFEGEPLPFDEPMAIHDVIRPGHIMLTNRSACSPYWAMYGGGGFYAEVEVVTGGKFHTEIQSDNPVGKTRRPYFNAKHVTKRKPDTNQIRRWAQSLAKGNGYA